MPSSRRPTIGSRNRGGGFTLLELLIAAALLGVLTAIALPSYSHVLERRKVQQAVRDLSRIALMIERFHTTHFRLPDTLLDLGASLHKDPWGADYQYLNFSADDAKVKGKIRKDHNLHPLNTQMDLYSVGPDGASVAPLTAKASRDDIIWARDGGFIGVATDF
jgi:general secretion pathway protein G